MGGRNGGNTRRHPRHKWLRHSGFDGRDWVPLGVLRFLKRERRLRKGDKDKLDPHVRQLLAEVQEERARNRYL